MNDPRLLTLLTLIKVKSYTKTAERLFITQPAVSQHIKSLEHQYDVSIFDGTKGFNLTKQGQILVEYARRMQNQDIQLKQTLNNSVNFSLPIKIGVTDFCKEAIINNEIFNSITEEYNYKLELLVMSSEDIFKNLESGNIDLAVIDNSYNDDLFEGTLIDTYNVVPFVHTEGKFKEIKRITREMLKNNPIIMSNDNEGMTISVKESLKKSNININPDNLYFSNSPYLMTKMIKQFDGIAFMYGNYVDSLPGIKKMELTNFKSSQNVYLIYSISSFEKANFKKICNKVKKA